MPNVVRTDIDALNAIITVTLPKEEYLDKVQKDIKKYTQKAAMKGFRPGKTPATLVKRMYGTQFLMDAVNEKVQEAVSDYLQKDTFDMLGQPIPSLEQDKFDLDLKNPQDLTFKFDVGLSPQFEITSLAGAEYQRYAIELGEQLVNDEYEKATQKNATNVEVEGQIQDNDVITLALKEVGGTLENEMSVSVNWMTEDMKSVFLTQSKGDTVQFNIFQLEKETTPQYARKYFLGLEDTDERVVGENFDGTITKIMRASSEALNEEFFQKTFGISTEAEAREQIAKALGANYENQADALMYRDIQDRLLEETAIELPDGFMKRWLKTQNERNTEELIERDYKRFSNNLRWSLIRTKILKDANVEITDEDLKEFYANKIKGYFGGMPIDDSFIDSLVDKVLKDEKQFGELYEEVLTEKLFSTIKSAIKIANKSISVDEFNSVLAAARFDAAKERGEIAEEAPVEAVEAE
jgi:trigger factor